jgi:hypothetical protein
MNTVLIRGHLNSIDDHLLTLAESFEDSAEEESVRYTVDAIEQHLNSVRKELNRAIKEDSKW